jgi:hypothetical protein
MDRRQDFLPPGTRVRIKGSPDLEGLVIKLWKNEKGEVLGYQVKPNAHLMGITLVALDNEIEVLGR